MWISDTSIKRPVFATMVILTFMVLGVVSMTRLGVDLVPRRQLPLRQRHGALPRRGAGGSRDAGHQADRGRRRRHQRRQAHRVALARVVRARRHRAAPRSRSAAGGRGSPREGRGDSRLAAPARSRTRRFSASTSPRCRSWSSPWARRQPSDVTRRTVEDELKPLHRADRRRGRGAGERRRGARDPGQPRSGPARGARACRSASSPTSWRSRTSTCPPARSSARAATSRCGRRASSGDRTKSRTSSSARRRLDRAR